jgi:hypothetical protein
MTPDPIGLEGGINLFVYVRGNPLRWIDRLGLLWEYHISSGELWYIPPHRGEPELVGVGYSGKGEGLNNPLYQLEENVGPIPEGEYTIGSPYPSSKGNPTFELTPNDVAQMFGRKDFLIHADDSCECFNASKGCIVLGRTAEIRKKIAASGDRNLRVVR